MKVLLTTLNAKYIHKNLALRWIFQARPNDCHVQLHEYTLKDDENRIVLELVEGDYDLICFSVYIWNIDPILSIVAKCRSCGLTCKILAGGPEVSYESSDLLERGFDALSLGEGEESVWEYTHMLIKKQSYEISGVMTKEHPNQTLRKTSLAFLETLDDPYFMDMDKEDMGQRYLYLETSRGCPYGCEYCLSSTDRSLRMFSLPYVLILLEKLSKSEVKQVKLLDRTFNADPNRALQIARFMNEHCKKQIFQFEVVAETLSEELLVFFETEADPKRFRFEIGVQSFHEPTLKAVGRIQNNARLQEVITRLSNANVVLHVDLIAGLPYEDKRTFQHSFDTLFALGASELQLGILKVLKGTALKKKQEDFGFVYDEHAPYAIRKTNWLDTLELSSIEQCATAVEKYWNKGACRFTIQTMLAKGWCDSAFVLFERLGEAYAKLPRPYAPQHFYQAFVTVFKELDAHHLISCLNMDYYRNKKQRPPHFHEDKCTKKERTKIKELAKAFGIASFDLDHYADMVYGYDSHQYGFLLIIYPHHEQIGKRWFVNESITEIKEWKE